MLKSWQLIKNFETLSIKEIVPVGHQCVTSDMFLVVFLSREYIRDFSEDTESQI